MGTIKIDNTSWKEKNVKDPKPLGDGAGTENQNEEILKKIKELLIEYFLEKFLCTKNNLNSESERDPTTEGGGSSPGSPGSSFGPGRIGINKTGEDPGFINDTNIYVGEPDPVAEELIPKIEALLTTHKNKIYNIDNC